ncbi:MAG: hypothetical protein J7K72_05370 [Candidatus Aenigmarchaeota archaeon]|nr:hypothetical protein [Candidatus Aenigmarchaeota archaeon]
MELLEVINRYCDIRLLKTCCNFKGCEKKPGKEMLIFQIDFSTRTKKDLISVYLCSTHYEEIRKNLKDVINKIENGKMLRIKTFDIGFVTY